MFRTLTVQKVCHYAVNVLERSVGQQFLSTALLLAYCGIPFASRHPIRDKEREGARTHTHARFTRSKLG